LDEPLMQTQAAQPRPDEWGRFYVWTLCFFNRNLRAAIIERTAPVLAEKSGEGWGKSS
jgi:hypothetical protein